MYGYKTANKLNKRHEKAVATRNGGLSFLCEFMGSSMRVCYNGIKQNLHEEYAMKSKAKAKKKNAPLTFREKCRRAFQQSIKCFDGAQNGNLEELVAGFDLDKKSIDLRVDAMDKARPMAEKMARAHIKEEEAYNFEADWVSLNVITRPPYNLGEEQFNYSLAAAIWMLDAIRANHKMDEALKILPREKEKLESVKIPKCVSPCYSESVIRSMVYAILHRNDDCIGLTNPKKMPADNPVADSYTVAGKQHQDVPSRRTYEGILKLLPEDLVDNAVNSFALQSKAALTRYFACRACWVKKESQYAAEIKRLNEELEAISNKVENIAKKATAYFDGKVVPKVLNDVPSISPDMDLGIQFASVKEQAQVILDKIDAVHGKEDALYDEVDQFTYDSIACSYWTEETWAKYYPKLVARRAAKFAVADPYEICFAFYYLIDEGDYLPWLYYPTNVLLSFAAAQLPWSGGAVKEYVDESSNRTRDIIENLPRLNIYDDYKTKDSRMIPIGWNELSLQLPSDSEERDMLRHTPAKAIYAFTNGALVPRNTKNADVFADALHKSGVTSTEGKAVYGAYISLLSNLEERIDFPADDTETLKEQCKAYERQIEKLKAETEKQKQELYQAQKALTEASAKSEKQAKTQAAEKQELNDLRELVFALTNDADSDKEEVKTKTIFPYHTTKKHIVFGGHPTWLKAIKPLLPDVRFIEGQPSSEQVKGAEVVWLQTNYMSHKAFYKIIDIVRSKNIPLRYFTSASATKGAEQVAAADSGK